MPVFVCIFALTFLSHPGWANPAGGEASSDPSRGALVAGCNDGHQFSALFEKNGKLVICWSINARSGRTREECETFTGSLEKFRANAAKCAEGRDTSRSRTTANCWSGFDHEKRINAGSRQTPSTSP